jgi:tetratricopeptide (TPR) repeat protein
VRLARESVEILRRLDDRPGVADGLLQLAVFQQLGDEFSEAQETLAASLALADELGDRSLAAAARHAQGLVTYFQGDFAAARAAWETSLDLLAGLLTEREPVFHAMRVGVSLAPEGPGGVPRDSFEDTLLIFRNAAPREATAFVQVNVAEAWRAEGRYEPAQAALERAVGIFRDLRDDHGTGIALNALGNLARVAGELGLAREWLDEALALRRSIGSRREIRARRRRRRGPAPAGRGDRDVRDHRGRPRPRGNAARSGAHRARRGGALPRV